MPRLYADPSSVMPPIPGKRKERAKKYVPVSPSLRAGYTQEWSPVKDIDALPPRIERVLPKI